MKEIDVIINAYNSDDYIEEAIKSVANQTIKNKIILTIVEDGGNTNYTDIIGKYSSKIEIKFYKLSKNIGVTLAREFALKHTGCQYFFFLDSDDSIYNNDVLDNMYNLINDLNANVIMGKELRNDKTIYHYGHITGKLFRRSIYEKSNISFKKFKKANEDVLFNFLYFSHIPFNSIIKLDKPVYIWKDINPNSLSHQIEDELRQIEYNYKILNKNLKRLSINRLNKYLAQIYFFDLYNRYEQKYKLVDNDTRELFYKFCAMFYLEYKKEIDEYIFNNNGDEYACNLANFVTILKDI